MPFNHCSDRLTNRSEEVNKVLSPLKLKGILMTLQSSQKYAHSSVTLTAELRRHLLRKHKHSKASCCCNHSASVSGSSWEEKQMYSALQNWSFWCSSFCLSAVVLLPALSVTTEAALPSIPPCLATLSTSWVEFPDPNVSEQQRAANQTWVQWAAFCLQIPSASLNL